MKSKDSKQKIIAIVGPTASGKSDLAIEIAKAVNGEIISADSRQVYRGMNIGSGKVPGKIVGDAFVSEHVPHYGIDIASPKRQYSIAQFKKYAEEKIEAITAVGKVPILCGGTGHWIDAVLFDQSLPEIKPNAKLRKQLEKKSVDQLFSLLKKKDPKRARTIDAKNPRRLIRALEIIYATGKPIPKTKTASKYAVIWIGLLPPFNVLENNIKKRLNARIKQGMLAEIKKLHKDGVSWKRLESFGLEYKYGALLLQKKIDKTFFEEKLYTEIRRYAKRQLTWFKRNKEIHWISDPTEAFKIIKK